MPDSFPIGTKSFEPVPVCDGHMTEALPSSTGKSAAVQELPKQIGRFEVRSRLGEGAFGVVYRAYDPQLDREVALKVAKVSLLGSPELIERFFREAKSAAQLRHPHIVPLFETGRDGDRLFIVSAFIEGRTLAAAIAEAKGAFDHKQAAAIMRTLADALAYAHEQGVIHRDVKPANVLLDSRGQPMLTDFGLAARLEGEERMTKDGSVMGTPAYMSPEQAAGRTAEIGPASDQYSLGCTFYELLTGRTPFEGPTGAQLIQHQQAEPKAPRAINRKVPRDLNTVCRKTLEKGAGKRYASCAALSEDLRRWTENEPIKARR